jgi:hypothetical protein
VSPSEFFEEILLDELGTARIPADASREPAQFNLVGNGGGVWSIGVDDEGLYVDPSAASSAPIQLSMTTEDWRAVVVGPVKERITQAGAASLFGPESLSKLFLNEAKLSMLRQFPGDIQFQIEDRDEAATYRFTLTLGGAKPNLDAPGAKILMQVEDIVSMLAHQSNPQQLFMQGKLRIEGDMNQIMGLMSVMMAP